MTQPADQGGRNLQRASLRIALAVGAIGVVCSLALGAVVHHAAGRLDAARMVGRTDMAADRVQLRLRGLETGLAASAAYLGSIAGGRQPDPAELEGFGRFAEQTVMRADGVKTLALLRDGWLDPVAGAATDAITPRLLDALRAAAPGGSGLSATLSHNGSLLALGGRVNGLELVLLADAARVFDAALPGTAAGEAFMPWRTVSVLPPGAAEPEGGNQLVRPVDIDGQPWRLVFTADPADGRIPRWEALAVVCFGLALSLLTAAHAHGVHRRTREKAELATRLEVTNAELRRRIAERERFAEVVRESERRFRDIYENALEGIFTTSPQGRFISANPAMVRMLGYETEQDLIDAVEDTSRQLYVNPARRAEFARRVTQDGTIHDFEAEIRRKDGSTLWLSMTARLLREGGLPDGAVLAFQGTAQDVTARRRAEEALRLAKEQADLANRAKTEFLANMSHELRTPLNAIIGFSEIIGDQALGPMQNEAYAEYARDIHESGRMLLDLINDILDLSKIEAGRKEINERTVDVPRLVRASMRLVRERALKGSIDLRAELPDGLPPVWADEVALKQILSNLLSNAVKFTPPGGTVTAGAAMEPDGRLVLTVRDTGIGIKAEDIPKALEPFRQIEGSLARSTGGVGLGLPLVQALVELHDGEFGLESEPGVGTVTRVWLPADRLRLTPGLPPMRASV
ncbi:PAS domain-containing sensor histidine kinase [Indioceanicola profundi]|uniref:PAS domain-containing sensor histidine kinase n=1 Tax=Indioceanicola profundi TaxID=2220096 RepID=UPI0013C4CDD7|nr:ATP-binding protein [Indioceanicola profundi]